MAKLDEVAQRRHEDFAHRIIKSRAVADFLENFVNP